MQQVNNLIDGELIKIGGKEFVMPPLNFGRLKKLKPELEILRAADNCNTLENEVLDAEITIIHSALTRNYPDITREQVEDLIDLRNVHSIMPAVMAQSGLVKREGGV